MGLFMTLFHVVYACDFEWKLVERVYYKKTMDALTHVVLVSHVELLHAFFKLSRDYSVLRTVRELITRDIIVLGLLGTKFVVLKRNPVTFALCLGYSINVSVRIIIMCC